MTKNRPEKNQCKYMRTKYNWTPNDYDLTFPTDQIPSNINTQDTTDLTHHLQKKFPISKTIHLNLDETNHDTSNNITCHTNLFLTINDEINEVKLK